MIMHPWANLKRIQGRDRLPDRRVGRTARTRRPGGRAPGYGYGGSYGAPDPVDPIRSSNKSSAFYQAIGVYAFEDTRQELYAQYHEMDFDAIIAAVLDAFATEAGQYDYERRRVVWVEAQNPDIQRVLTRSLDRLRIDQLAYPVMRAVAKNGDYFTHIHASQNEGVVALKPYKPFEIARIEDGIGRLLGFAPSDEEGNPAHVDSRSIQAHQALHFRLPPRETDYLYGAQSSFLWGGRIMWRQLQLMLDQVVIQRLLRRPDRVLILMDVAGMSMDDAMMTCKDWERRLHRETTVDINAGEFHAFGMPLDGAKDLVLPRGANNQTEITNVPATNQNDLMRDVDLYLSMIAAGIGFPLGFVGRGQGGDYNPSQTLSRQYQPFAKKAGRLQHAFLSELARLLMVDLAWNNLNPYRARNAFTLHMASVAPIVEIERSEVLQMRLDRMERGIRFGQDAGLDMGVWVPYVLEFWGGLPRELVEQLYKPGEQAAAASPGGLPFEHVRNGNGKKNGASPDRNAIMEAMLESFGTPADSRPFVDSTTLSGVMQDRYIPNDITEGTQGGGQNRLLEGFTLDKDAGKPLFEAEEFDFIVDGEQYKAAVPRRSEELDETHRRRAASRIEVMGGLARRVLNEPGSD